MNTDLSHSVKIIEGRGFYVSAHQIHLIQKIFVPDNIMWLNHH